jgi:hypothetical protein
MSITSHVVLFVGTNTHGGVTRIRVYERIDSNFRVCEQHTDLAEFMLLIPEGTRTLPVDQVVEMGETFNGTLYCIQGSWP